MRVVHWVTVGLVLVAGTLQAWACSIPVFRYALERWEAAPYRVTVFHEGALSAEDQKIIAAMREFGSGPKGYGNLAVDAVDLADKQVSEDAKKLWEEEKKAHPDAKGPWVVVRYPEEDDREDVVFSAALGGETAMALLDSPARREIAKRLLAGESAVWVQLDSGEKAADDKAVKLLESELARLTTELKLPEIDPADAGPGQLRSELPLKLAFSRVRIGHNDPAERLFRTMLVQSDPDTAKETGPMIFPVFGRGRALPPLAGKRLTADQIGDYAAFLTGSCSCEVKRLNPGTDMLIAADWSAIMEGRTVETPAKPALVPIPPGKDSAKSATPVTTTRPIEALAAAAQEEATPGLNRVALGGMLGAGLLVAFTAGYLWRSRGRQVR